MPAYFRPDLRPDDWEQLAKHADQVRLVILNVANGPGTEPDPAFYPALNRLREAGVAVAGYVDTDYGRRPAREALADLGCSCSGTTWPGSASTGSRSPRSTSAITPRCRATPGTWARTW